MEKKNLKQLDVKVVFVGLKKDEEVPKFAVYKIDTAGRPIKKLSVSSGKSLKIDQQEKGVIAIGPDVDDFNTLPKQSLTIYRLEQHVTLWSKEGLLLPRDIWNLYYIPLTCVTGTVKKCFPWYWEILENVQLKPLYELVQAPRIKPITSDLLPHIYYPHTCLPLCDGIVEVYERECCCYTILIWELLERLRDALQVLPIPLPDPLPDPGPYEYQFLRTKARAIKLKKPALDMSAVPPKEIYDDYIALRTMSTDAAQEYVLEHPYLYHFCCRCTLRKVGQTAIQPGGDFRLCYPHFPHLHIYKRCITSYAFKIKQLIDGVMTVVYDGLAAHQYFSSGSPANIHTYNPQAIVCANGPGEQPPDDGDGTPFIMLEYIGRYDTNHFNTPVQTGVSQVAALAPSEGTYTTNYAPNCPWGGELGLRLWFSPALESIVKYYRLKVVAVNESGSAVGTPKVLNTAVNWDKLVDIPGDTVVASENLGPLVVGAEKDLFKVPYWKSPDHRYLTAQYHQMWNTAQNIFPDGKYMLILEVFDAAGNHVKPTGATGTGTAKDFKFRRWSSVADTDPVPFSNLVNIFWVDNTPVGGDIVDLRENGVINTAQCQFISGPATNTFEVGFRAYHENGVDHAGNGDNNSFMWHYAIRTYRGINGPSFLLNPAPSGGTNHTDVGETGPAVSSGSITFGVLLDNPSVSKCTFSVWLRVYAKHFTGWYRIHDYDYYESASFALELIT